MTTTTPTIHDIRQLAATLAATPQYQDIVARIAPRADHRAIYECAAVLLLYHPAARTESEAVEAAALLEAKYFAAVEEDGAE